MFYKKPSNIRYWECAKYIDKNIHSPDRDENKLFEYMYHLFYILAVKSRFFQTSSDYDNYAIYGATQLFLRYKKEEDPKCTLKPIKSSLNYIKSILYPLKVNYQKDAFGQIFQKDALEGEVPTQLIDDKTNEVRALNNNLLQVEYTHCITQITSTIKMVLNSTPYKDNPKMLHNLYLSCLLTFINTITMSKKNLKRFVNKENRYLPVDNLINQIYTEENKDNTILYHLDKSMTNYVSTLVNLMKKEIVKDLRYIIGSYELPDSVIKAILVSPIEELIEEY